MGRRVTVLHDGLLEADELHRFTFEARALPSGLYVYQVIGETFTYLEEALLATERIKAAGQVAMVTMSFEQEAKSYEGHDAAACAQQSVAGARHPTHYQRQDIGIGRECLDSWP